MYIYVYIYTYICVCVRARARVGVCDQGFILNGALQRQVTFIFGIPPRCQWTAAGGHPTSGRIICADLKTLLQRRVDGLKPASACLWTGPRAQALLLRGRAWVAQFWANSVGGGPSTGPTPRFIVVVSPCRCEPLRAGCCGGEGVLGVV